jgi:hypothetical protein
VSGLAKSIKKLKRVDTLKRLCIKASTHVIEVAIVIVKVESGKIIVNLYLFPVATKSRHTKTDRLKLVRSPHNNAQNSQTDGLCDISQSGCQCELRVLLRRVHVVNLFPVWLFRLHRVRNPVEQWPVYCPCNLTNSKSFTRGDMLVDMSV